MNVSNVGALCFDTGGTILDWHTGMRTALAAIRARHGVERDWTRLDNEFCRRSLKLIVNHGEHGPATMTFDDAHRDALDQVLADNGLSAFTEQERRTLWWDTIHDATVTLAAAPWLDPSPPEVGVRVFDVVHDKLMSRQTKHPSCETLVVPQ